MLPSKKFLGKLIDWLRMLRVLLMAEAAARGILMCGTNRIYLSNANDNSFRAECIGPFTCYDFNSYNCTHRSSIVTEKCCNVRLAIPVAALRC